MTLELPFYLRLGPVLVHPHWLFETIAYLVGARLYTWVKRRTHDPLSAERRWWIVAAAFIGAAIGSKIVYWLSEPALTLAHATDPVFLMGGKSVVGGLVGAILAVELAKHRLAIVTPTGDVFAVPLAVGIGIGRIGCFLSGLEDHTHGLPATLPWAIDYGDGIPRHPAQLYEIAFLSILTAFLLWLAHRPHHEGDLFRVFVFAYLTFRLGLEFLKPGEHYGALNLIQWVCLIVLPYYVRQIIALTAGLRWVSASG
jgi:phosphatidylglycerol---prolipoprotein diacylglyceryl transferase